MSGFVGFLILHYRKVNYDGRGNLKHDHIKLSKDIFFNPQERYNVK
jgi:hypothetical protein